MTLRSDCFGLPLDPGWEVEEMRTNEDHPPLALLRHGTGARAVWFLHPDGGFRANTLSALAPAEQERIHARFRESAGLAWKRLIVPERASSDAAALRIWRLGEGLSHFFPELSPGCIGIAERSVHLDASSAATELAGTGLFADHPEAAVARMGGLFARDQLHDFRGLMRDGALILPSPFDASALNAEAALPLDLNTIAYRFAAHGVAFYVVSSLWRAPFVALFFPAAALTVFPHAATEAMLKQHYKQPSVVAAFVRHLPRHAAALAEHLQRRRRGPAIVYTQEHLGHHLYNELGGFHAVMTAIGDRRPPRVFMVRGGQTEMYGKLDALYPHAAGAVDRSERNDDDLARVVYSRDLFLARPCDAYVPADLARRIRALADADPTLEPDRRRHAALIEEGFIPVGLGLRVENRAPVNQADFFIAVIDALRERMPRLAFIVDGHDAHPDGAGTFTSHVEHEAKRAPIGAELEILDRIRAHCAGLETIEIVSTVGAPMARTLFWCARARFVVTSWGAGLAKYRWACGRPCLVVSNRALLDPHQHERDIYDSPLSVEAPAPVTYFQLDDVEDAPEDTPLIDIKENARVNFRVRLDRVGPRIDECLAQLSPFRHATSFHYRE